MDLVSGTLCNQLYSLDDGYACVPATQVCITFVMRTVLGRNL